MSTQCPFCGSEEVEQISAWGGQIITSQARCRGCGSYFEVIRESFTGPEDSTPEPAWTSSSEDDR